MVLSGSSGFGDTGSTNMVDTLWDSQEPYAIGMSPALHPPENEIANAKFAGDPSLHTRVSVQPRRDLTPQPPSLQGKGESPGLASNQNGGDHRPPSPSRGGAGGGVGSEPKVTSADVLESL